MQQLFKFLLLFIAVFQASSALACSCARPTMLQVAENGTTDNIIQFRVLSYENVSSGDPSYMEGEVLHQWRGDTESEQIKIYGSDGFSCLPSVTDFDIGKEWVLPLFQFKDAFGIAVCAPQLLVEDSTVTGLISSLACPGDPNDEYRCNYLSEPEFMSASAQNMTLSEFEFALNIYSSAVSWSLKSCEGPWVRCSGVRPNYNPENGELTLPSLDVLNPTANYGVSAKMKLLGESPPVFEVTEVN